MSAILIVSIVAISSALVFYTIGVWSEVTTEKVMGRMTSHCSGIWRPLASIPAGRRLELHRSNGTVTDVTPRQN